MMKFCLGIVGSAALATFAIVSNVDAADLGGDCCADIEQRVAELENARVRRGNKKVSLTIAGWVGEQVTNWDDGLENNTYVTGLGTAIASHVTLSGQAEFALGWTAGYVLHLEAIDSDNVTTSQGEPDGPGVLNGQRNSVQVYQSYWFIKNDRLGKVSVGKQSSPSDNGALLVDGSGTLIPANWIISGAYSFKLRNDAGGFAMNGAAPLTWGGTGACFPGDCLGLPFNIIRYDSPTWGGFSFSSSYGEGSIWDIGLRYSGEYNDFKIAAAIFYGQNGDNPPIGAAVPNAGFLQVGAYVQHMPSGVFGFVNYGALRDDAHTAAGLHPDVWHVKTGVRTKWNPLGATIPYGEYMTSAEGLSSDSRFNLWGAGVVQDIDDAAMSVFFKWRQYSFESEALCADGCKDLNEITLGAVISF